MRSFLQIKPYLKTQRDTKDESRVAGWGAWGGGVQGGEGKSSPSPSPSPPHHQLSCAGRALCRTQFGNHCLKKRQITKYLSFQNHKLWMYDWTDVNGYLSNLSGTISLSLPLLVPGFCAYYCMLFLPVSSAFQSCYDNDIVPTFNVKKLKFRQENSLAPGYHEEPKSPNPQIPCTAHPNVLVMALSLW